MSFPASARSAPCHLCQHTQFERIGDYDRKAAPLHTVICCRCGLISHEVIPTESQLAEYYAHHYRHDYHGQVDPAPHRVVRAWHGGRWLLNLLRPYLEANDRVAEIGAGLGCTVKVFELAGFNSSGIEPNRAYCQFGREQLQANIAQCGLFDLAAEASFDVVLFVHVIEHLNSPLRALARLRQLLPSGGRLYVECPNIAAPHAAPGKQFHYAHVYNFAPHTLVWSAQMAGFEIHAQLCRPTDRVLRFVFRRADRAASIDVSNGYRLTRNALQGVGPITYHLRPRYLADRLSRDLRFLSHRFAARRRVRQLITECRTRRLNAQRQVEGCARRSATSLTVE